MAEQRAKPKLRLAFVDFWPGFDPATSFLTSILGERFDVEVVRRSSILIFGPYGAQHLLHRGTKVLVFDEPGPLPKGAFDFALSWHDSGSRRELRFPGFYKELVENKEVVSQLRTRPSPTEWARRPHFCNFIYSNTAALVRRDFYRELSKRAYVHAPGIQENNAPPLPGGRSVADFQAVKIEYQRAFRFTIAFENTSHPGYTTEKLVDALAAGTVPIYWGNPRVGGDVPEGAYINAHDFSSLAALADRVMEVEHDERLAAQYLSAAAEPRVTVEEMSRAVCDLFEEVADYRPSRGSSVVRPLSLLVHGGALEIAHKANLSIRYRLARLVRSRP